MLNIADQEVWTLDSLDWRHPKEVEIIKRWAADEVEGNKRGTDEEAFQNVSEWPVKRVPCLQQADGTSCGMVMCNNIKALMIGQEFGAMGMPKTKPAMTSFRAQMLTELMQNSVQLQECEVQGQ